ncbi:CHAP domain-containing protein [Palleronia abyssalis]|uniref:Peptidase C51 domain-containing protein n=1 Tax=Palleronia abyssalis TaxID=1501240 RepID=A0A2R8BY83_9RHOB|nr:CHAP domain-containing protein [Palleronia abyssalis]SPJ25138.1 hypothetical protein PAA8504_02984 [Palleronia abyssalis]
MRSRLLPIVALLGAVLSLSACGTRAPQIAMPSGLNNDLVTRAVHTATDMDLSGKRVWCVPFARNASGIYLRGDAHTWWDQAQGQLATGQTPSVGAVMTFSDSAKLRRGHLAVVSQVVSDREIRIHHANWERNKVSLDMGVIDVSDAGDWSRVRVESVPGAFGGVYPVDGFIRKN